MILLILLVIFYLGGGLPFLIELLFKTLGGIVKFVSWVAGRLGSNVRQ